MHDRLFFGTFPEHLKKKNFLLTNRNLGSKFQSTDTRLNFYKNLKKQGEDWYYKHNPVKYSLNNQGYRTKNFEDIDWKESVVIFGCSNVFGSGLTDEDTISERLSQQIGRPVINMGVGGTSILYSLFNSAILNEHYPTPKGIIHIWTHYSRSTYFTKRKINFLGEWNKEKELFAELWNSNTSNSKSYAWLAKVLSSQIWKDKTSYYEASFFDDTAELLGCDNFRFKDLARDMSHPGRNTAKSVADIIAKRINV